MYKKVLTKGCTKKYFSYYRGSRRISKKEYDNRSVNYKQGGSNYKYKNLEYFEKLDIIKNETLDEYNFEEHIYIQIVNRKDDVLFVNIPDFIKNCLNKYKLLRLKPLPYFCFKSFAK